MSQMHEQKTRSTEEAEQIDDTELKAAQAAGQAALDEVNVEELDRLLDEIDDVLEENAETFVQNFVQRGGQ